MKALRFVHIPKTGGTTIEQIAFKRGIFWGALDQELFYFTFHRCPEYHKPLKLNNSLWLDFVLQKYDFFCVVRNPYSKCVSEFYCKWNYGPRHKCTSVDEFNSFIQKYVKLAPDRDHWASQTHFVYDDQGQRIVKHVLKCENLQEEFNTLMREYGYNIEMTEKDRYNSGSCVFGVKDLSRETIDLINYVYHDDFVNFGYAKV